MKGLKVVLGNAVANKLGGEVVDLPSAPDDVAAAVGAVVPWAATAVVAHRVRELRSSMALERTQVDRIHRTDFR